MPVLVLVLLVLLLVLVLLLLLLLVCLPCFLLGPLCAFSAVFADTLPRVWTSMLIWGPILTLLCHDDGPVCSFGAVLGTTMTHSMGGFHNALTCLLQKSLPPVFLPIFPNSCKPCKDLLC